MTVFSCPSAYATCSTNRVYIRLLFILLVLLIDNQALHAQAIIDAVKRGDEVGVRRMLATNAQQAVTDVDSLGNTALQWAAELGRTKIAQLLLLSGADVNSRGDGSATPILHAARNQHLDTIDMLVSHGANIEAADINGSRSIHQAALHDQPKSIVYLLMYGADIEARMNDGSTPLTVAALNGQANACKLLIGAGADIHAKNNAGSTPLDEALRGGKSEIASIITQHEQDTKAYAALVLRRSSYWANVRTSYANWRNLQARTKTVYKSDFANDLVGPEWLTLPTPGSQNAPLRISSTPKGNRKFLGELSSQSVRLKLDNLPAHHEMAIIFDLYIIRTMDGNDINYGPDIWSLSVLGGAELLTTTFANTCEARSADKPPEYYKNLKIQAYPGEYPMAYNAFCTGADEVNTLGYTTAVLEHSCDMDSVYKIRYTFPHTEGSATFNFSAMGLEVLDNESWGIANIEVSVDSVPAPAIAARPNVGAPHPIAANAKPKPTVTRAATAHKPGKPVHKLAAAKHKPTGKKTGSGTTTSTSPLHAKKTLTP